MANRWGSNGNSERLYFWGTPKITADGDCSHEIKRCLLLGRQVMTNLDSIHSEKAMAPHSSTLPWRIPWTEEPDGLPSMGSHRVGHDWRDSAAVVPLVIFSTFYFVLGWLFCLFNLYAEYSCEMLGWMKHKLESRFPGEISIISDMQMTPVLWQKMKRN